MNSFPYNLRIDRWLPEHYPDRLNFYRSYETPPPSNAEKNHRFTSRDDLNCATYFQFYHEFHQIKNYLDSLQKMDLQDRALTLLKDGKSLYQQGQKVAALWKFDEVLELEPQNEEANCFSRSIEAEKPWGNPLYSLLRKRRAVRWDQRNLPFPYSLGIQRWLPENYPDWLNYFPNYNSSPEPGQNLYGQYYQEYHAIKEYLNSQQPIITAGELAEIQSSTNEKFQALLIQYQALRDDYIEEKNKHIQDAAEVERLRAELENMTRFLHNLLKLGLV